MDGIRPYTDDKRTSERRVDDFHLRKSADDKEAYERTLSISDQEAEVERKTSPRDIIKGISRRMRNYSLDETSTRVAKQQSIINKGKKELSDSESFASESIDKIRNNIIIATGDINAPQRHIENPQILLTPSEPAIARVSGSMPKGRANESMVVGRDSGSIPIGSTSDGLVAAHVSGSIALDEGNAEIAQLRKKGFRIDLTGLKGGGSAHQKAHTRAKSHSLGSGEHERIKLSLYSPQLSSRRAYMSKALERAHCLDLSKFSPISGGDALKLDKTAKKTLMNIWKDASRSPITAEGILKSIQSACQNEIERLFLSTNKHRLLAEELCVSESPRTKQLLNLIQKSGLPLLDLIKGMEILLDATESILQEAKVKTTFLAALHECLVRLTVREKFNIEDDGINEGKDLGRFVSLIESVAASRDKLQAGIKKIIFLPFGDKSKTYKEIIGVLRQWTDPDEQMLQALREDIHKISWKNLMVLMIPKTIHEWKQKKDNCNPFENMLTSSFVRDLTGDGGRVFSKISANNQEIYSIESDSGRTSSESEITFFSNLLKNLFKGAASSISPQISLGEVSSKSQSFSMGKSSEEASRQPGQLSYLYNSEATVAEDEKKFPALQILKFASQRSWKIAELFIRMQYPKLFEGENAFLVTWKSEASSETCTQSQDLAGLMECDITATSLESFSVSLTKTYHLFPMHTVADKSHCNWHRKLATIPFVWTMEYDSKRWIGKLRIKDVQFNTTITDAEKWSILDGLIYYRESEFGLLSNPFITWSSDPLLSIH
jgi:hypothetical protein